MLYGETVEVILIDLWNTVSLVDKNSYVIQNILARTLTNRF